MSNTSKLVSYLATYVSFSWPNNQRFWISQSLWNASLTMCVLLLVNWTSLRPLFSTVPWPRWNARRTVRYHPRPLTSESFATNLLGRLLNKNVKRRHNSAIPTRSAIASTTFVHRQLMRNWPREWPSDMPRASWKRRELHGVRTTSRFRRPCRSIQRPTVAVSIVGWWARRNRSSWLSTVSRGFGVWLLTTRLLKVLPLDFSRLRPRLVAKSWRN